MLSHIEQIKIYVLQLQDYTCAIAWSSHCYVWYAT